MWILWGLLFLLALFILNSIRKAKEQKEYFTSRGIYYLGHGLPNLIKGLWYKRGILETFHMQYNAIKESKAQFGGGKEFGMINLLVSDPTILKHVLVKDFDHFVNRRNVFKQNEMLLQRMLIFLNDEQWKALRSKLSPTFTTGKIKRMFKLFDQSAQKLVNYVENKMKSSGELDLTEGYSKMTMDVIASAVCGIDSQAFLQDEPSQFEKMGKRMQLSFGAKALLKFVIMVGFPKIAGLFGLSLFGRDTEEFFSAAIKGSIAHRQSTGEKRDDFIQLMLEARAGQLKLEENELDTFEKDAILKESSTGLKATATSDLLDDDGIAANCVLFILAGFDTTQSLLLFCAYALAINQDVQEKLREEIVSVVEENDGQFTYDGLQKMNYLDMVINETLRFYPPAPLTDRGCTQDYQFPGTDIVVKKGQGIVIPIYEIHHDPNYYPDPEKFDPERFSPQNKSNINPYTFLAFGQGPRNCIGMRFALTEVKLAIAHLVLNFSIEPSSKTSIPMVYDSSSSLKPKHGMWLALNKRN